MSESEPRTKPYRTGPRPTGRFVRPTYIPLHRAGDVDECVQRDCSGICVIDNPIKSRAYALVTTALSAALYRVKHARKALKP